MGDRIRITGVVQLQRGLVVIISRSFRQMESSSLRIGSSVWITPPTAIPFVSVVTGVEMASPYDPERDFAFMLGDGIEKESIPVGSVLAFLDFDWEGDPEDDCRVRWDGLVLRAEKMEVGRWWWAVHDLALGEPGDAVLSSNDTEPSACSNGAQARAAAELAARTYRGYVTDFQSG